METIEEKKNKIFFSSYNDKTCNQNIIKQN